MGHLTHPTGFRLNFDKKWDFTFYLKNIYYPEFMNTLINIRDYLYYFFTSKKMLISGFCFSNLSLYKHFKNYFIYVYLYHIDLEKSSYDFINLLYTNYYDIYNKLNHKFTENRTEKQTLIYKNFRDLSNSDLFVFYYTFVIFYQNNLCNKKNQSLYLNNNNIFIIKNKLYDKIIRFYYIQSFLFYYIIRYSLFTLMLKSVLRFKALKKEIKIKALKKRKKQNIYFYFIKPILKNMFNPWLKSKYRLKLKNLTENKKYMLEKCLKWSIEKKIKKIYFFNFLKKKKVPIC